VCFEPGGENLLEDLVQQPVYECGRLVGRELLGEFNGFVHDDCGMDFSRLQLVVGQAQNRAVNRGLAVRGPAWRQLQHRGVGLLSTCVCRGGEFKRALAFPYGEGLEFIEGILDQINVQLTTYVELEERLEGESANVSWGSAQTKLPPWQGAVAKFNAWRGKSNVKVLRVVVIWATMVDEASA